MDAAEAFRAELEPDIRLLADALFAVSAMFLRRQDRFLPHGAVLTRDGEVRMVAAAPDAPGGLADADDFLPRLHEGLRHHARSPSVKALAVAENVTLKRDGQRPVHAIKVLFEHERGLCIARYLPFEKKLWRGHVMGVPFSRPAAPEVKAWPADGA